MNSIAENLITKNSYERIAIEFSSRNAICGAFSLSLLNFAKQLPLGSNILDVGCGHGRDAREFKNIGYNIIGIDYALEMVRISKKAFIPTFQMDMRAFGFANNIFDGIWVNSSLHHNTSSEIPNVINEFGRIIKPRGKLFISCRTDLSNNWDEEYANCPRFYNNMKSDDLSKFLEDASFNISAIDYLKSPKSQKLWFCIWATKQAYCGASNSTLRPS